MNFACMWSASAPGKEVVYVFALFSGVTAAPSAVCTEKWYRRLLAYLLCASDDVARKPGALT